MLVKYLVPGPKLTGHVGICFRSFLDKFKGQKGILRLIAAYHSEDETGIIIDTSRWQTYSGLETQILVAPESGP